MGIERSNDYAQSTQRGAAGGDPGVLPGARVEAAHQPVLAATLEQLVDADIVEHRFAAQEEKVTVLRQF